MPDSPSRSQARLLAPIALVVAAIAVFIVLTGSLGGSDDDAGTQAADTQTTTTQRATRTTPAKKQATTYTVKTGDSLGSIAEKTGVTIEKLQEVNPDVDPQALVAGQKIKLTE